MTKKSGREVSETENTWHIRCSAWVLLVNEQEGGGEWSGDTEGVWVLLRLLLDPPLPLGRSISQSEGHLTKFVREMQRDSRGERVRATDWKEERKKVARDDYKKRRLFLLSFLQVSVLNVGLMELGMSYPTLEV